MSPTRLTLEDIKVRCEPSGAKIGSESCSCSLRSTSFRFESPVICISDSAPSCTTASLFFSGETANCDVPLVKGIFLGGSDVEAIQSWMLWEKTIFFEEIHYFILCPQNSFWCSSRDELEMEAFRKKPRLSQCKGKELETEKRKRSWNVINFTFY